MPFCLLPTSQRVVLRLPDPACGSSLFSLLFHRTLSRPPATAVIARACPRCLSLCFDAPMHLTRFALHAAVEAAVRWQQVGVEHQRTKGRDGELRAADGGNLAWGEWGGQGALERVEDRVRECEEEGEAALAELQRVVGREMHVLLER
eukprot:2875016-Rhodomonas_salina.1